KLRNECAKGISAEQDAGLAIKQGGRCWRIEHRGPKHADDPIADIDLLTGVGQKDTLGAHVKGRLQSRVADELRHQTGTCGCAQHLDETAYVIAVIVGEKDPAEILRFDKGPERLLELVTHD